MRSRHNDLNAAMQHQQAGELAQAEAICLQIVRRTPYEAEAWNLLGIIAVQSGKAEAALEHFRRARGIAPSVASYRSNSGAVLQGLGRYAEAEKEFRAALKLNPTHVESHYNLGKALELLGRLADAEASYRVALNLRPTFPEAHNNRGAVLRELGQYDEAEACYLKALQLQPAYPEALNNLGALLTTRNRAAEALPPLQRAAELKPDFAEAHYNLGNTFWDLGRSDEARAHYQQAVNLQPNHAESHKNLALLLLTNGDYERGWAEYEWRWRARDYQLPTLAQPRWDGSNLTGKTILLHAEQGLGDAIHFVRYASLVKARGATVLFCCRKPLVELVATCPGVDRVIPEGDALPPFDVHAPLLDLPRLFHTTVATIPAPVPYLTADPLRAADWRKRLETVAGFRVGLVWQGNPGYIGDLRRSVPLTLFAPLAAIDGVTLLGLQVGSGREHIAALNGSFAVTDLAGEFDPSSLSDVAAVLQSLDLLITVDTALAHLAGALNLPVWAALPFVADWRWLQGREDSPWYPSMRLFRQSRLGDWNEVFERITQTLTSRVDE